MIAIVNMGPHNEDDPLGMRTYEVRINSTVICEFQHRRGDGLSECLLKASQAVKKEHERRTNLLLERLQEELATTPLKPKEP